ncbi:hypothetical protein DFH09DRAFT_1108650 [Mycena vulgaris]|nr:hypothetical protein DFH09DRAFT_1108650 [Mycena vulgaris]
MLREDTPLDGGLARSDEWPAGGQRKRKTPCPRPRVPTWASKPPPHRAAKSTATRQARHAVPLPPRAPSDRGKRYRTTKAARGQRRAGPATKAPVRALAGKPARAEKRQRAKCTGSPQQPLYSRADRVCEGCVPGCGWWLPRRYDVRLARTVRFAQDVGSRGVSSTQQDDTQIRGGEGGRARRGGPRKAGEGGNRQEEFEGKKECNGKGAKGKPENWRMRLGMKSVLQARREYKRRMGCLGGRTR